MTDPYATAATADDIIEDDTESARLDRQASDFLANADRRDSETRSFAQTTSIRQAVREDLSQTREWARSRAASTREAIVDEPIKVALYAVGAGVLIGLLLRR
ncbi:hypothetical protein KOAAANKH_03124 [Brevundimonas sp. NIBR10]|uniref:hypothetical protein n=1 Tax=Brevundimonas sp. NIBR10 TaxID=3015997 RepID=UPI0022F1CEAD|nr:hypothetical protein [Brevundimonas sp. NIBR10]WGM48228.1 hypothetical protein KOAAANKH_03124 [Brevundimonas sp. NIBR10]